MIENWRSSHDGQARTFGWGWDEFYCRTFCGEERRTTRRFPTSARQLLLERKLVMSFKFANLTWEPMRAALWLCVLFVGALAQIGGGSVVGNVTDQTGAIVPSATVKITNTATGVMNTSVTNAQGYYEFPLLPAGRYVVEVQATGFQSKKTTEFELNAGTRPRFDFALSAGNVAESVTVEGGAPLVNATTTELGVVIDQRKIQQLPLNGRNYESLLGLQAGVVVRPPSTVGGRGGVEFNGAPAFGNNITMDGVDSSFGEHNGAAQSSGLSGFAYINNVSVDAIQEIKTSSSAFSAEYGRATGGVIVLTTKSGTNQWHGTAFDYLRNDALDANSFDNNRRGVKKNFLRFNQFGGNLGGPIAKDKLFFFFNYEGVRQSGASNVSGNIPTPLLLERVNAAMRTHLNGAPKTCSNPIANQPLLCFHVRPAPRTTTENTYLSRVDYQYELGGAHRAAVRYNYVRQLFNNPQLRPDNIQVFPVRTHNAVIQDSWTLAPTLFNELRVGFSRFFLDRNNTTIDTQPAWVNAPLLGDSDFASRLRSISNTYMLNDNVTWVRDNQTWKLGFEIRDVRNARLQATNPTHYYTSLDDLIADRPLNVRASPGNPGRGFKSIQTGFYFQDDWRVTKQLQLNLGLRYEYYAPLKGPFNLSTSDPFSAFAPKGTPLWKPDKNNFAPRLGLVYDVRGDQRLVVRAGGAVAYAPQQPFFYYDFSFIDPRVPFSAFLTAADIPAGSGVSLNFPFPKDYINRIANDPNLLPRGLVLGRNTVDPNRRDEYVIHYNLSVQYAVSKALAVQATYSGSRGLKLLATTYQNLFRPGTSVRLDPNIGQISYVTSQGRHTYNSLQLSANARMSKSLTYDVYYTLSKNLVYGASDSSDGPRNFDVQDFSNLAGSYGPKVGDARHRLVNVFSYEVPMPKFAESNPAGRQIFGGWSLQGIQNWRSGVALNVTTGALNLTRNGQGATLAQRPDLVSGQAIYDKGRAVPAGTAFQFFTQYWLNPDAFDLATPYAQRRFGTASYNLVRGPNAWGFDASLIKSFQFWERHQIQFRTELFNAFNHANDNNPDLGIYAGRLDAAGVPVKNPNFGLIGGRSGNRNIQFGLKYIF
jgi:hypothetical protein